MNRRRGSSVVERTLGKGEVESSILSRGTIHPPITDIDLGSECYMPLHVMVDIPEFGIENRKALEIVHKVVSLHVRRGDYLDKIDRHPPTELSYCKDAIDHFGSNYHFYVMSDDIDWGKKNLKGDNIIFIEDFLKKMRVL